MIENAGLEDWFNAVKVYLSKEIGGAESFHLWQAGQAIADIARRVRFYSGLIRDIEACKSLPEDDKPERLTAVEEASKYDRVPVDIKTFIEYPQYLDKLNQVYPKVMEHLIECNNGNYVEVVFTGGIGSGKTTAALYTIAYQLYLLSCMSSPHRQFGLDTSSEILFIFQSINAKLAKQLDYNRFRAMIEEAPYFKHHFPFKKDIESKLIFPNRIEVVPVSGQETAAIGQNVIGGLIDELNYMSVVEKSALSVDGGAYDQAVALYNSIARRRKSRFASRGQLPGILCLVSSKKYPGQFTDKKEEEAKKELKDNGKTTIYIYDKRVWQIAPAGRFGKGRFTVFIGDVSRKPRVVEPHEKKYYEHEPDMLMEIPYEYRGDFDDDIINALREIAGVSTLARHPFFVNTDAVTRCFGKTKSILTDQWVDFKHTRTKAIPKLIKLPQYKRYCHIDLGLTGDSAGVAVGHVPRFKKVKHGDHEEMLPIVKLDFVLEVRPPKNDEIHFENIRQLLYKLRELGLPITWVSLDSYQSVDTLQILRSRGFITGLLSMDKTRLPYEIMKTAAYDGRLWLPEHDKLKLEMVSLEDNPEDGKIDHPANGSKDLSDAVAGVTSGLTMRREIWFQHGIHTNQIPESIKYHKDKLKSNEQHPGITVN